MAETDTWFIQILKAPLFKLMALLLICFSAACPGMLVIAVFATPFFDSQPFSKLIALGLAIDVPVIGLNIVLGELFGLSNHEADENRLLMPILYGCIFSLAAIYIPIAIKAHWDISPSGAIVIAFGAEILVLVTMVLIPARKDK